MIPNCLDIVERLKREHPDEWAEAHTGRARTEDFIRRLAWVLHSTVDERFGLLGQRGSASTIADDAVLWKGEGPGHDPSDGNRPVSAFDVIVAAGSPSARPGWGFINEGGPAVWVRPSPVADWVPVPVVDVWTPAHEAIKARMSGRTARALAEQLCHTFPGEAWGEKRAAPGRGISDDTIARLLPDGTLFGVRVLGATHIWGALPGQVFEAVQPVNHLGDPVAPPPLPVEPPPAPVTPPPVPPPPALDTKAVLDAIAALSAKVDGQRQEVLDAVRTGTFDIDVQAGMFGRLKGTITGRPQS